MLEINEGDTVIILTFEGLYKLAEVMNYFISPINNKKILMLRIWHTNTEGLFEEEQIVGKVQLKT